MWKSSGRWWLGSTQENSSLSSLKVVVMTLGGMIIGSLHFDFLSLNYNLQSVIYNHWCSHSQGGGGGCCCSSDGDKLTRGYSETSHIYAVKLASHPGWTQGDNQNCLSIEQWFNCQQNIANISNWFFKSFSSTLYNLSTSWKKHYILNCLSVYGVYVYTNIGVNVNSKQN